MSGSSKGSANGTIFKIENVNVGSLKSIGGLKLSAETIDLSTMDSPDNYKEYTAGMKDGGEISLSGLFDFADGGQVALYEAFEAGTAQGCEIVFPAAMGCMWRFNAVVTAVETSAELDDAVSWECTLKVTGKPTLISVSVD